MPQSWNMGQIFYVPSGGRHAEDFYVRKIQRLRPGLNPQTWVPETNMLTTRPPKPSQFLLKRPRQLRSGCRGTFLPFISAEDFPSGSENLKTLDNKLWVVLEDMACRKCHNNLESRRRFLAKAVTEIPVETERVVTAEWQEGPKACVEA